MSSVKLIRRHHDGGAAWIIYCTRLFDKKKPAEAGFLQVLFLGIAPSAGCQAANAKTLSFASMVFR
jgi:hypothetical protein